MIIAKRDSTKQKDYGDTIPLKTAIDMISGLTNEIIACKGGIHAAYFSMLDDNTFQTRYLCILPEDFDARNSRFSRRKVVCLRDCLVYLTHCVGFNTTVIRPHVNDETYQCLMSINPGREEINYLYKIVGEVVDVAGAFLESAEGGVAISLKDGDAEYRTYSNVVAIDKMAGCSMPYTEMHLYQAKVR